MQMTCPNCGETVSAENINIQQMGAVCPYCDSVFRFELPGEKAKRRKIKPREIRVFDSDLCLLNERFMSVSRQTHLIWLD
jgi:ssDNA-binding Zn-finger/Zn-ribbon topoisomerase 1